MIDAGDYTIIVSEDGKDIHLEAKPELSERLVNEYLLERGKEIIDALCEYIRKVSEESDLPA